MIYKTAFCSGKPIQDIKYRNVYNEDVLLISTNHSSNGPSERVHITQYITLRLVNVRGNRMRDIRSIKLTLFTPVGLPV